LLYCRPLGPRPPARAGRRLRWKVLLFPVRMPVSRRMTVMWIPDRPATRAWSSSLSKLQITT